MRSGGFPSESPASFRAGNRRCRHRSPASGSSSDANGQLPQRKNGYRFAGDVRPESSRMAGPECHEPSDTHHDLNARSFHSLPPRREGMGERGINHAFTRDRPERYISAHCGPCRIPLSAMAVPRTARRLCAETPETEGFAAVACRLRRSAATRASAGRRRGRTDRMRTTGSACGLPAGPPRRLPVSARHCTDLKPCADACLCRHPVSAIRI